MTKFINFLTRSKFIVSKKRYFILVFSLISVLTFAQDPAAVNDNTPLPVVSAENTISLKDAKEISYQAQATIESLQGTLNYITFNDNAASELADVITNSYKDSRSRVFYDSKIIIEDDLNPQSGLGNTKDIYAIDYLNKMDLQYDKTGDASISFSNIVVSNVKKKDYIFVNVIFDANYGSKFKPDGSTYPKKQRCALVRVDRSGANKWVAFIMSISFYNPANPIENADNNMQIATDLTKTASVVSQEDFDKEKEDFIRLKQEEEKRNLANFEEYLSLGNSYIKNKQYNEALEFYLKAKELQPMVPSLDKKIMDSKKLVAENTFENYNNKGDRAKTERRFNDAIQFYKQAITLKPDAAADLGQTISMLTQKLAVISLPKNKLQANDFTGAILECEKVLREHKKEKNEFPELYYIQGMACLELGIQSNDSGKFDDALEHFNTAVQFFPNYKDARLARIGLFVNQKYDFIKAITDYDVLATNEFDDSPDKPVFFVAKAKLKDKMNNSVGALADYDQAILLHPTGATIYFDKGELEYRLQQFFAAEKNFSTAIKLNPEYKNAYYYRGLCNHSQNKIQEAGADFEMTEKLGFEPEQVVIVDAISETYFKEGESLFANNDFQNAHFAFDKALEIRKCNAKALHKKAEIWLRTGEELGAQATNEAEALSNFNQSIEFNKQAILCNPNFSQAHLKKGIAYNKIGDAALAIDSFSAAINSDSNNVSAYIERGNTYQFDKKHPEAIESYIPVIFMLQTQIESSKQGFDKSLPKKLNDNLANVYMSIGISQYYNGDYNSAMLSLNSALNLNKLNHEALYYRGLTYFVINENSKAIANFEQANKLSPKAPYFYACGKARHQKSDFEGAVNDFNQVELLDTLNALEDKYYFRALSLIKTKQFSLALSDFEKHSTSPDAKKNPLFYANYGLCQLYLGQDSPSEDNFNNALNISSSNGLALFGMGCSNMKAGQFDLALDFIEKAFFTKTLQKSDIKMSEEMFFAEFNKVKANKVKYNQMKAAYVLED